MWAIFILVQLEIKKYTKNRGQIGAFLALLKINEINKC